MTHLAFIQPLLFEPGDRLELEDFLARWEQMPDLKFAELIDGVVHMPSPLSYDHGDRDNTVQWLLKTYATLTGVCKPLSNATWLVAGSAPQPDAALRLLPKFGGRTTLPDKLAVGAPELVMEICYSSRSYDLGPKLALYQRAGVSEYVAILLEEQRIEWRGLMHGSYVPVSSVDGVFRSAVFPGLWVDEKAFWADESRQMLQVLEEGVRSEECSAFVARIGAR